MRTAGLREAALGCNPRGMLPTTLVARPGQGSDRYRHIVARGLAVACSASILCHETPSRTGPAASPSAGSECVASAQSSRYDRGSMGRIPNQQRRMVHPRKAESCKFRFSTLLCTQRTAVIWDTEARGSAEALAKKKSPLQHGRRVDPWRLKTSGAYCAFEGETPCRPCKSGTLRRSHSASS